jgi:hypothetical protein
MKFKNALAESDYKILPRKLKEICDYFEMLSTEYGVEPVVTRVAEPVEGDSGVHEARRAVDFRCEQYAKKGPSSFLYSPPQTVTIEADINAKFKRPDGRPTCMYHRFHGDPYHFHIQLYSGWLEPGEPQTPVKEPDEHASSR